MKVALMRLFVVPGVHVILSSLSGVLRSTPLCFMMEYLNHLEFSFNMISTCHAFLLELLFFESVSHEASLLTKSSLVPFYAILNATRM